MRTEHSASTVPDLRVFVDGPDTASRTLALRMYHAALTKNGLHVDQRVLRTDGERVLCVRGLLRRANGDVVDLELVTAPGAAASSASRSLLLLGADGVLFLSGNRPPWDDVLRRARRRLEDQIARCEADTVVVCAYDEQDAEAAVHPRSPDEFLTWLGRVADLRRDTPRRTTRAPLLPDHRQNRRALWFWLALSGALWLIAAWLLAR